MNRIGTLQKLTPRIGAEILDVDLTRPTPALVEQIRRDLLESLVVFFRDQTLSRDQLKALGAAFGRLHLHPVALPRFAEHPEIIVIESDETTTKAPTEVWHSDASADPTPPLGSILYMSVAPSNGGDTLFANMYEAYEALSPRMQAYLAGLTAIHDGERLRGQTGISNRAERLPFAEHPVIRTHPETGRKFLYVNRVYTAHIVGIPKVESDAILAFLFAHQEEVRFQCRFKWRPHSIAFWDNRCTLHSAVWDYYPERRYAERVTICGDAPR